jgi:hypothetical protein
MSMIMPAGITAATDRVAERLADHGLYVVAALVFEDTLSPGERELSGLLERDLAMEIQAAREQTGCQIGFGHGPQRPELAGLRGGLCGVCERGQLQVDGEAVGQVARFGAQSNGDVLRQCLGGGQWQSVQARGGIRPNVRPIDVIKGDFADAVVALELGGAPAGQAAADENQEESRHKGAIAALDAHTHALFSFAQ